MAAVRPHGVGMDHVAHNGLPAGHGVLSVMLLAAAKPEEDESGGTVMRHSTSWRTWLWGTAAKLFMALVSEIVHKVRPGRRIETHSGSHPEDSEGHRRLDLHSRGHIAVVTPPRPTPGGRDSSLEGLRAWEEHHVMESEMPNQREGAARTRDRNPSRALEMMLEGASPEANRHWMA